MLPVPTLDYLAQFTGRSVDTYSAYAEQALVQATLMFSTVTKLEDLPTDPDKQQLAINGILQMADRLYLEQPYAATKASPFNSESIGSYSYSKGYVTVASKAASGELTGLFWWDLAVEELSQVDRSLVGSGSVGVFDHQLQRQTSGRQVIIGPEEGMIFSDILPPGNSVEVIPADQAVDYPLSGGGEVRG